MAALARAFDPTSVDPDSRPEPFEPGRVRFMVKNTEVRATKDGTGSYLVVEHEVQSGPAAGRKWFNQITLDNRNVQAVEIGQKQLSALCHAVGYLKPLTDSDALHGRTGEADVDIEPAGTDKTGRSFPAKNVTKRYVLPDVPVGKAAPKRELEAAGAPAPTSAKKKPWEK